VVCRYYLFPAIVVQDFHFWPMNMLVLSAAGDRVRVAPAGVFGDAAER
jgi:hypothetical protein